MVWLIALFISISLVGDADAYIDPGAGSYIIQIAIASVVAALFFIKSFFQRIMFFINKVFPMKKSDD